MRKNNSQYDLESAMANSQAVLSKIQSLTSSGKADVSAGRRFSQVDNLNTQLEYAMTQEDRAYQQYLYEEFESPEAQVRQYNKAGLNPALVYGSGSSGGSSVGSSSTPDIAQSSGMSQDSGMAIFGQILQALFGAANVVNDTRKVEIDKANAATAAKNAETQKTLAESQANKNNADATATSDSNRRAEELHKFNLTIQENAADLSTRTLEDSVEAIALGNKSLRAKIDLDIETKDYIKTQSDQLVRMNDATIKKINSEIGLMFKQGKLISAQTLTEEQEKELISAETNYKKALETDENFKNSVAQISVGFGIDPTHLDLVYGVLAAQNRFQSGEITDDEFAEAVSSAAAASRRRGRSKQAAQNSAAFRDCAIGIKSLVSSVTDVVGAVVTKGASTATSSLVTPSRGGISTNDMIWWAKELAH